MARILFVANGHGESAIAARIARAVASRGDACDLFPLVGTGPGAGATVVGPRRSMPSGGLVAMGNVRAFAADVRAGFFGLLGAQVAFLRGAHRRYDAVVAVGDAYALALALLTRRPTAFVGTAKSVYVAPYGPAERALLRRAARVFVRDAATARRLRDQGVAADAPGNAIVDLAGAQAAPPGRWIGILPGSRDAAYADGVRLARVARALGPLAPEYGVLFSVAPNLESERFAGALAADDWLVEATQDPRAPFVATSPGVRMTLETRLGAILAASSLVLGQAGTANEQAAACGIAVVALDDERGGSGAWYRMRQRRLLGEALLLVPTRPQAAASAIAALLHDPVRVAAMGAAGRARMGEPGGAEAIARAVVALAAATPSAPCP
ncbi:MAG: hypothetical protein NVS1B2_04450 [Vulcanimicrobiaceae bacterium]